MHTSQNWGMLGHMGAVDRLRSNLAAGKVHHAYLITGPQGVGRRTLALRFAQALNCTNPPAAGEPCRACRACTHFEAMQHPDLMVVQAEKEGGTLKVEQVRELMSGLALHPYEATYRIALLLRFDEAHPSAMNALLKTLEEPPAKVILLLTADSVERLLPTVVSRCEVLRLRNVSIEATAQGLQSGWGLSADRAHLLAHISGGRPGYAVRLTSSEDLLEQRRGWLDDLKRLFAADRLERFAYVRPLKDAARKPLLKELFAKELVIWLSFWRDVLLKAAGSSASVSNLDDLAAIETLAEMLGPAEAYRAACAVEEALDLLDRNVNTRLVAETLMIDLPKRQTAPR